MRLFIALQISKDAEEECKRIQSIFPAEGIVKTKGYHLTLKFLGEVKEELLAELKNQLLHVKQQRCVLHLSALGFFPSKLEPKVIWIGVEGEVFFRELLGKIDKVLTPLFPPEKQFMPHITLARVKKNNPELERAVNEADKILVQEIAIPCNEFILYHNILGKEGAIHKEIIKIPLFT